MTLGAVLAGGRSRRFGVDKALHLVDGRPMVRRVADALLDGGAVRVVAVGGDAVALAALGLEVVTDRWPGEGPLGGVLTALGVADDAPGAGPVARRAAAVVIVAACDLPDLDGPTVRAVLEPVRLGRAGAAIAVDAGGRRQPLLAAWRVDAVEPVLATAFASGVRSMHDALDRLVRADVRVAEVAVTAPVLRNVNHPSDLAR